MRHNLHGAAMKNVLADWRLAQRGGVVCWTVWVPPGWNNSQIVQEWSKGGGRPGRYRCQICLPFILFSILSSIILWGFYKPLFLKAKQIFWRQIFKGTFFKVFLTIILLRFLKSVQFQFVYNFARYLRNKAWLECLAIPKGGVPHPAPITVKFRPHREGDPPFIDLLE